MTKLSLGFVVDRSNLKILTLGLAQFSGSGYRFSVGVWNSLHPIGFLR